MTTTDAQTFDDLDNTENGSERRRELIRVMADLVAEEGIDGATIRKVARRAGVSTGMVSHYFPAKRDLIMAVHATLGDEFRRRVDAQAGEEPGPERLRTMLKSALSEKVRTLPSSFWLEYVAEASRDEELGRYYVERFERNNAVLKRSVESGIERGEFSAGHDPEVIADILQAVLFGTRVLFGVERGQMTEERAARMAETILQLIAGASADKGASKP
jgi:AcrR family transcriptional regulator